MARRRTLGENPLDLIVPKKKAGKAKTKKSRRVKTPSKNARSRADGSRAEKTAAKAVAAAAGRETDKPRPMREQTAKAEPLVEKAKAAEMVAGEAVERRAERKPVGAQPGQYLTFLLGGEEYGAGILQVKEIIEYDTLTRVPTTPPWIRGVINLRGSVVPVIDLAVKFGLPGTEITSRTCIVIVEVNLEGDSADMGVMVDSVSQVVELSEEEIEAAPAFGTHIHVDYLLGMGRLGEKFVLLLNVDRVLSSDELLTASVVTAGAPVAEESAARGEQPPVSS